MLRSSIHVLLVLTAAAAPALARGEWVYAISKSGNSLVRFNSANTVNVADTAQTTPVTTLVAGLAQPSGMALGPDGRLYIAEWGDGGSIGPRISRYDIATGQWAPVVSLNPSTQAQPAAIAFRPTGLGGQMLVGRVGTLGGSDQGGIVQVSGWNTGSPSVSASPYNSGLTLNGSSGLAVAADGTTYVSNSQYVQFGEFPVFIGNVVSLNATGGFVREIAADGSFSGGLTGPAGLILQGSSLFIGSVTNGRVYQTTNLSASPPTTTEFGSLGPDGGFEAGPILRLSDGSTLVASVSGSGVVSILGPTGTLSTLGYYAPEFGQIGGIVVAPVPEPGSVALVVAGLGGLGWALQRRRRNRKS